MKTFRGRIEVREYGPVYRGRGKADFWQDQHALARITRDALAIGLEAQRLVRESKGLQPCH